ncbi:MAG: prepilin peptidase CpaA [Gammaproteobacteria bacterium]|jgi:prepilin peptidase CpaA
MSKSSPSSPSPLGIEPSGVENSEMGALEVDPAATDSETELQDVDRSDAPTDAPKKASAVSVSAAWIVALSCAAVLASALQIASKQREHGFILLALCFVVCFAATWVDVATRRIPNVLTYPAIVLGLVLNGLLPLVLVRFDQSTALVLLGSSGTIDCLQGFGLCAAIGIVSFMARGLGGGDVKLLGALGAMLGFDAVIAVLFNTLLVAAVLGIANWAARGSLMKRVQGMASAVYFSIVLRDDMRTIYGFKATEGPFALSLMIGLIMAQFISLHQVLLSVAW